MELLPVVDTLQTLSTEMELLTVVDTTLLNSWNGFSSLRMVGWSIPFPFFINQLDAPFQEFDE